MAKAHRFGGDWTDEKLDTLKNYLVQYRRIFTANPKAAYYDTTYVDAFAGTGSRMSRRGADAEVVPNDEDAQAYRLGSVPIALELESPFNHYFLIDKNPEHAQELHQLGRNYPERDIKIEVGDANEVLQKWCKGLTYRDRGVVFLDPYGMQVKWQTIEAIARTQAIDMWLLFPLGQAVNRLLTKNEPPNPTLSARLTETFGTEEWKTAFYKCPAQGGLFDSGTELTKQVTLDGIAQFFLSRLSSVFAAVAPSYKPLMNSRNAPIYILCFAAANPKGAPIAIRIANHLLKS